MVDRVRNAQAGIGRIARHDDDFGAAHAGFEVDAVDRRNIMLNGVSLDRLGNRRALLNAFDRFRRQAEGSGVPGDSDEFQRQAFEVLTSPRLAEALDLSREDRALRRRYGLDRKYPNERQGKTHLDQFLLARRVIEAGVKVSGCTVHFADDQYDTGPIVIQRTVEVADDDTAELLADKVFAEERRAYPEALRLYAEGRLRCEGRRVRILPASQSSAST